MKGSYRMTDSMTQWPTVWLYERLYDSMTDIWQYDCMTDSMEVWLYERQYDRMNNSMNVPFSLDEYPAIQSAKQ